MALSASNLLRSIRAMTWHDKCWVAFFLCAAVYCFFSFNWAFNLGALAFLGLPIVLFKLWRNKKQRSMFTRIALLLSFSTLLIAAPACCSWQTRQLEQELAPAIATLHAYHKQHGFYPAQAQEAGVKDLRCLGSPSPSAHYYSLATVDELAGQHFKLTCMTYSFNKHVYDSNTRQWRDWD